MGTRPLVNFLKNNSSTASQELDEDEEKEEIVDDNQEEHKEVSPEDAVKAFKEEFSRKLGWTSKEEWEKSGRDPNLWRDYDDFLENSPTYFERLRKKAKDQESRMKRNAQAAAAAIEEEAKRAREEAIKEAREAATAGDPERAAAAVERAAKASPPPETQAWIAKNSWFNEDPEAQALAVAAVNRAAAAGASVREQLEAASNSVKKRFPEYFEEHEDVDDLPDFITRQQPKPKIEEAPQREVRMSDSKKVAAAVAANANNGSRVREVNKSKEKGFNDIPKQDQAMYEKYFARKFQNRGMTAEAAREKYAKTYWTENKE